MEVTFVLKNVLQKCFRILAILTHGIVIPTIPTHGIVILAIPTHGIVILAI